MIELLLGLPAVVTLLLCSALIFGIVSLGRMLVRRFFTHESLREAHDVSAVVYANIGVVYAIVVGLMAVHGQERYIDLRETSERESARIIAVGRSAQSLNSPLGEKIAKLAAIYASTVAKYEWNDDMKGPSPQGRKAMLALWDAVHEMEATGDGLKPASQTVLNAVNDLMMDRMSRISLMQDHIGRILWFILLGGGGLLIGFVVLFEPKVDGLHRILTLTVIVSVVSVLLLIFMYEHPTDGALSLTPEAYVVAADLLSGR